MTRMEGKDLATIPSNDFKKEEKFNDLNS